MKIFKSKVFIFCLIGAILLTLIPTLIAAFGGSDMLGGVIGSIAKPFSAAASGVANSLNGFISVFTEYDSIKAENAALKEKLAQYEQREYDSEVLREQNKWLKDYINLHEANPSFILRDAMIIGRESGNYSTVITLNKGSVHGIKKNMPVITAKGLLGYVSDVGLDWCKVATMIEPSSAIGVYTERTGERGVVQGDAALWRDGLCKMSYIESNSSIQIDDRLYTQGGADSLYPSGLLVGRIRSIDVDEATGEMVAQVSPAVSFTDLSSQRSVMIICGFVASTGE